MFYLDGLFGSALLGLAVAGLAVLASTWLLEGRRRGGIRSASDFPECPRPGPDEAIEVDDPEDHAEQVDHGFRTQVRERADARRRIEAAARSAAEPPRRRPITARRRRGPDD